MLTTNYNWRDWEGQGLLRLKRDTMDTIKAEAPDLDYRLEGGGFPEGAINELMLAAYRQGFEAAKRQYQADRERIVDEVFESVKEALGR